MSLCFPWSVLTMQNHHRPEHSIAGVYASKAEAVAASGSVDTEYGPFDKAIDEMFEEDHEDNREDPPNHGCLLQLGHRDSGEGDIVGLKIDKFPLIGAAASSSNERKV